MNQHDRLKTLLHTCAFIANRNLCPATAGNFSVRASTSTMLMSASGKDKTNLSPTDFITCNFEAKKLSGEGHPSAEAALHGMIYQLSSQTQCVLHTHSVAVTVLSMLPSTDNRLQFQGYEMQKTIAGFQSHEETLSLTVFDNDQNMIRFAQHLKANWDEVTASSGFIVRGHGLYCWGDQVKDARRHMEGLEFLMACELQRRQIKHD
jgi:methylthioribulose-1-phosphate dehydratase